MSVDPLARYHADAPPDWPTALIALVDALRDYIRAQDDITRDLLDEEQITADEARSGWWATPERAQYVALLKKLESHELDPQLRNVATRKVPL